MKRTLTLAGYEVRDGGLYPLVHRRRRLIGGFRRTLIIAAIVLAELVLFVTAVEHRERDLAFDNALTKLCASYVRWTKLAHDHVEGMDRRCNLGAKE